ncbi:hypothetical protein BN13_1140008 [Nostocoides jenkinsii Ben 74]|uniref:Uncharacterized protein n=1 Tax=Nostocoides jenkinsii Ben 74 TaxID=1193518 RepID=A0A077M7A2_9MICO|nr:hypothetical protein BN13_1140008 [Tetrasphaera jenkinsii Ben 74]
MEDLADPNAVPGIVSLEPRVLECEECHDRADADTIGLPLTGLRNPARGASPVRVQVPPPRLAGRVEPQAVPPLPPGARLHLSRLRV